MRLVKKTTMLAVLPALALALLAGVGTASADTLCKANEEPCSKTNNYAQGTGFSFTHNNVMLSGGGGVTTCTATYTGTLGPDPGPGNPRSATITGAVYTNCTGACTGATPLGLNWTGTWTAMGGGGNGTLRIFNERVLLSGCAFGLKCGYMASEAILTFKGGKGAKEKDPALLMAESVKFVRDSESSKLCPETGTLTGEFEVTKPEEGFWLVAK